MYIFIRKINYNLYVFILHHDDIINNLQNIYKDYTICYVSKMNTVLIMLSIIFICDISNSLGFLNKLQLNHIKFVLTSPDSSDEIKKETREILVENYQPWLKNQYKSFIRQNGKKMNTLYVRELYQYAISGLLESLQAYNGSVGLHKYADKFVYGEMYKGVNELSIMKPMSLSQAKKGYKTLKPLMVSYDDYWIFDKLSEETSSLSSPRIVEDIQEIMRCSPAEYNRLFFLRYDYHSLSIVRSIADICEMEAFSEETYRKKMKTVLEYIKTHLMNEHIM